MINGRIKNILNFLWAKKEAFIWIAALLFLAVSDPADHHYTLCPFSNLGFEFCPGCGIGHSIGYLFRGDFIRSFETHPLGIFAIILISYRTFQILGFKFHLPQLNQKPAYYGKHLPVFTGSPGT
jgi:hypothetical protein